MPLFNRDFIYVFVFLLNLSSIDHSVAAKSGGCFPGDALVTTETGLQKPVRDVRSGERVLALSSCDDARLEFSEVLGFLDRDPGVLKLFFSFETESGAKLTLTAAHLMFVAAGNCSEGAEPVFSDLKTVFASDVHVGQCTLVREGRKTRLSRVTQVDLVKRRGIYAPLTEHGTLVVDGVATSCYAAVNRHSLAHRAFAPLRLVHRWTGSTGGRHGNGVHWYARVLHWLGRTLMDAESFHPMGAELDGSS